MKNNYKIKISLIALLAMVISTLFAQHDTIQNGGFEAWTCPSYCDPNHWLTPNSLTTIVGPAVVYEESSIVHSGSHSAKLETESVFGQIAPGLVTTATYIDESNDGLYGGMAMNYRPSKITGWYRYAPSGQDTFIVSLFGWSSPNNTYGTPMCSATFFTTSTVGTWTKFSADINYTTGATPDTLQINIASGTGNNSHAGSIAYVDDVQLVDCSTLSVSVTPGAATCTNSDGSAFAVPSGGTGPFTYSWSNTGSGDTISSISANSYTVSVTDDNGCTAQGSGTVTSSNVPFTLSISSTPAICTSNTGTATVTPSAGTAPYTYLWNNSQVDSIANNLGANSYSVTVTDSHGCSASGSATVTSSAGALSLDLTSTSSSCVSNTGSVTASASAGTAPYTYLWNTNSDTAHTVNNLGPGNYSVTATDSHGCSASGSIAVSTPTGLVVSDSAVSPLCHNGSNGAIYVNVSGGTPPYAYTWNPFLVIGPGLDAGVYDLTVTDSSGCSATTSVTLNNPPAITLSFAVHNALCYGASNGAIAVSANNGTWPYAYLWNNLATDSDLSGLSADTYSVIVTDSNGCTATDTAQVGQPAALAVTNTQNANVLCNGYASGSINLTVAGGTQPYSYTWTCCNGQSINGSDPIGALAAGDYRCIIADSNACSLTVYDTLTEPAALNLVMYETNASSATDSDGAAGVSVTGGVASYTYAWSNSGSTDSISSLLPATYIVTVTDNNHCSAIDSVRVRYTTGINELSMLRVNIYPNPAESWITVEVNSGSGEYILSIYSADGKLVAAKSISGKSDVDVSHFSSGIYTSRLIDLNTGAAQYVKFEIVRQ